MDIKKRKNIEEICTKGINDQFHSNRPLKYKKNCELIKL